MKNSEKEKERICAYKCFKVDVYKDGRSAHRRGHNMHQDITICRCEDNYECKYILHEVHLGRKATYAARWARMHVTLVQER